MNSLHTKFLTLLLGSVFLAVLLVGGAGILTATQAVEEDSVQIMTLTCEQKSQEINAQLLGVEQAVDTIYSFADMQLAEDMELWSNQNYMDGYTEKVSEVMENVADNTEGALCVYMRFAPELLTPVSGIFMVKEENGSRFINTPVTDISMYDADDREHVGWYYEPLENGGPTWMHPYENKNINKEMISYIIPIYRDDVTIGVIGMDIDLGLLKEKVGTITAYDTGYAILMGENGDIIYSKEYPDGIRNTDFSGELLDTTDYLKAVKQENGTFSYDWHGEKRQLVFSELANGMRVALVAPKAEIDEERNQLIMQCGLILLLGLLVATLLGIRMTRRLTKPLRELTQVSEQMANGHWDVDIECNSKDEVGVLAQTLKRAVKELNRCMDYIGGLAYSDSLTGLNNRHYIAQFEMAHEETYKNIGVAFCDLNGLKYLNDHHGHAAGDRQICLLADLLRECFPDELCCRLSGDEFVAVVTKKTKEEFFRATEELRRKNEQGDIPVAAIGICWKEEAEDIQDLITEAEHDMYRDKNLFYEKFPQYRR